MRFKQTITFLSLIILAASAYSQEKTQDTLNYEFVYGTAVKGEVPKILEYMDTLEVYRPKEVAFKNKFEARFKYAIDQTEDYFDKTDTLLNPLHRMFQRYWRNGLLHPEQDTDSLFKQKLIQFFNDENRNGTYSNVRIDENNLEEVYKKYIESKGYHCTGFGRAGKFYDFLVWRTMEPKSFEIDLIDHTENVHIYFMKDFLSLGWMEYSRLGERYPGGWATEEALYCVTKGYDQSSEKFNIIYLKHEGQHFYDYKRFPGMESRDLEYRGKLIEMVFCENELYNRVSYYLSNAKNDPRNAHPHANYRIIADMSRILFNTEYEDDFEKWKAIPKERLHKVARKLYDGNTDLLLAEYKNKKTPNN